ncbi:hypothetical protein NHB34_01790 [Polynucleobacter sp. MWH-UH19D]|uniref:hypothetical protein n=1 Tax=Polynucleobacter sp. MWH-UH19D TaxID=1855610 RepID=UPI003364ECCD
MLTKIGSLFIALRTLFTLNRDLDLIKINQGLILSKMNLKKPHSSLSNYEFKVFSQWGEDGIIQHLIQNVFIKNKNFIEFGVEDFFESNCRFLLQKDNWDGFVIDGSSRNIKRLRNSYFYWKHSINALCSFITRENIEELLSVSGFDKDIGLLSVDIDGVDYFVLEKLTTWTPRVLIVEFNAMFGMNRAVSVPYSSDFVRSNMHHSNLYYGASLPAFIHLANNMNMALVGVNSAGSNAFFVRRDLLNESVSEVSIGNCFVGAKFREGRDVNGALICQSSREELSSIMQLPLIDVITQATLKVGDLAC